MTHKILVCICGLLSVLLMAQAEAASPTLYTCKGKNVALTYNAGGGGAIGANALTINIGKQVYSVRKADIESSKSVIGTIKSITTKFMPDVAIYKTSFIIPDINLGLDFQGQMTSKVNFNSQLVLTRIATPFIAPPFIGIVNNSNYIDLTCSAALVYLPA